eukprot:7361780-Prymnesium_polylepis.1
MDREANYDLGRVVKRVLNRPAALQSGQCRRINGIVGQNAILRAAVPNERAVGGVDYRDKLCVGAGDDLRILCSCQALTTTPTIFTLIEVEESECDFGHGDRRPSRTVLHHEGKLSPVPILSAAVFGRVEVDLCKLAIQSISSGVPRPVVGGVADLKVERAASDAVGTYVAIEQCVWQSGVKATKVGVQHRGVFKVYPRPNR